MSASGQFTLATMLVKTVSGIVDAMHLTFLQNNTIKIYSMQLKHSLENPELEMATVPWTHVVKCVLVSIILAPLLSTV